MTVLPLGPKVTATALAKMFTPANIDTLPSLENLISLWDAYPLLCVVREEDADVEGRRVREAREEVVEGMVRRTARESILVELDGLSKQNVSWLLPDASS